MNIKDIVKKNFSRYADKYDLYASVQNHCAHNLMGFLADRVFHRILDIGCGTGSYTKLLGDRFLHSAITAVDISEEMVSQAREKLRGRLIDFITADAETAPIKSDFDLITSNACIQWFVDTRAAVARFRSMLKADGVLLFSTFGPETLNELNSVLAKLYKKDIAISSQGFFDEKALSQILNDSFGLFAIRTEAFTEQYDSLSDLLNRIKYTGTRGRGIGGRQLLRSDVAKAESIYKDDFGRIEATYQIYYCQARK